MFGLINRNFCLSISKANAHSFNPGESRSGIFKLSYRAINVNIKVGKSETRKVRKRKVEHPAGTIVLNKGKYITLTALFPDFRTFPTFRLNKHFQIKIIFLPLHPRRKDSGDNVEYIKIKNGN